MRPLSEFSNHKIDFLFTDIDDTLTDEGKLKANAYEALWQLHDAGIKVIPVTGRPAGWCEMIARFWPVDGVIGENGGLYFRYHEQAMQRYFVQSPDQQKQNRLKLNKIAEEILNKVPGCAIASDQFTRLLDLAIDFAEDVKPLPKAEVEKIVKIFESHGAQAKISSIHVNGWFDTYNKLSMCKVFLQREFNFNIDQNKKQCTFVGDSPNDEPMFEYFPISFAVANIQNFRTEIRHLPTFVANKKGGEGFVEVADLIIAQRAKSQ